MLRVGYSVTRYKISGYIAHTDLTSACRLTFYLSRRSAQAIVYSVTDPKTLSTDTMNLLNMWFIFSAKKNIGNSLVCIGADKKLSGTLLRKLSFENFVHLLSQTRICPSDIRYQ